MKRKVVWYRMVALSALASLASVSSGLAQPEPVARSTPQPEVQAMGPEDLRATLLKFVATVGVRTQSSSDLYFRIADMNAEELQALYAAWPDPAGFTATVDRLVERAAVKREGTRLGVLPTPGEAEADTKGIVGVLPPCEGFEPDYPSIGWLEFIEGIIGEDLTDEKSRCSEDLEEAFIIVKTAAVIAATIAQAACDSIVVILGEGTNVPFCVAAGIANGVKDAAEFVLDACAAQDAAVNAAEIEAGYENTKIIIDALCCTTVDQQRKIQGCNGQDDDCDGTVDECDEDKFGPTVFIDASVAGACFKDAAEAQAALLASTYASDDCGAIDALNVVLSGAECDVTATITATDDCGNETAIGNIPVTIDGDGATVTFDPSVNAPGVCYASIDAAETAVLAAMTVVDNCSTGDDITVTGVHSSVDACNLRVRIDVVDKCGNASSAAVTVRVDTDDPDVQTKQLELGFRGEVLAFQTPPCYATVEDALADVLDKTRFEDNCTADEDLSTGTSATPDDTVGFCRTTITASATDACLQTGTDKVIVRVDDEDPAVTCSVTTTTLWPANLSYTNVGFSYTATDNCPDALDIDVKVTSDEQTTLPPGKGQASPFPDAVVLKTVDGAIVGVQLRNERGMPGDGRVYKIHVYATDPCGNVGHAACTVSVPSADGFLPVDSGQYFDATGIN